MNATDLAKARDQSTPSPDADSTAEQSMAGLLRPYVWSFAAIVILQVIGAIAGLAPLPRLVGGRQCGPLFLAERRPAPARSGVVAFPHS
ncbi:hypothetical protein [Nonomuraea sp. NPDC049784]|uniref:hypothetical protein n=1 Tax=Nonomuraea sp. NPDC049784 TaxID=3154361 RepID=UPI0033CFE536